MTLDYVKYDLIFNRKNKLNQEGKALVQVRAYCNGQSRFFSTNIYIPLPAGLNFKWQYGTPLQANRPDRKN